MAQELLVAPLVSAPSLQRAAVQGAIWVVHQVQAAWESLRMVSRAIWLVEQPVVANTVAALAVDSRGTAR